MTANRKLLSVLLISLYFVLALSSCQYTTTAKNKRSLKGVLHLQKTDRWTTFAKNAVLYKPIIADEIKKIIKTQEKYKPFVYDEVHHEGVFYNRAMDTIYFLATLESWIKKDAKLPDSIKEDANKKGTVTVCFLGIKQHDTIIIQDRFHPDIYSYEKYSKKRIFTEKLRQKIFDKFVDHVIENRRVSYDKAYFNDSVKENDNLLIFKPLYDLIDW